LADLSCLVVDPYSNQDTPSRISGKIFQILDPNVPTHTLCNLFGYYNPNEFCTLCSYRFKRFSIFLNKAYPPRSVVTISQPYSATESLALNISRLARPESSSQNDGFSDLRRGRSIAE